MCGGGDQCQYAMKIKCDGVKLVVDFSANPNGANATETYNCPSSAGIQSHKGKTGKELIVAVDAPAGTPYSLWWQTGGAIQGFTFTGACGPDDATNKTANAYDAAAGKGVCSQFGWYGLKGVAGKSWHVFEGDGTADVNVSCGKSP